ncbi:MAG TPA: hypothetical protein VFQ69_06715 [Rhizomicrobium sp.]|nr:hypothetical protein [Rhizomicrobium sp.]
MSLPNRSQLSHSQSGHSPLARPQSGLSSFEGFLFADIGMQPNGMPLTILTLLARGGLDPWAEAERLSRMSRSAAASCMIAEINRASDGFRSRGDVRELAKSLVDRLPAPAPKASIDVWTGGSGFEGVPMLALMTVFFAIMTITLLAFLLHG